MIHDTSNNFRGAPRHFSCARMTRVSPGQTNPMKTITSWWCQPPHLKKICKSQSGFIHLPQFSGWTIPKCLRNATTDQSDYWSHSGHFFAVMDLKMEIGPLVQAACMLRLSNFQSFVCVCRFSPVPKNRGSIWEATKRPTVFPAKMIPKKREKKHAQIISNPRNHGVPLCNRESLRCNFSSSNFTRDSKRSTADKKLDIWLELPQIRRWCVDKALWIAAGKMLLKREVCLVYTLLTSGKVFSNKTTQATTLYFMTQCIIGMICPTGCGVVGCQSWLADLRAIVMAVLFCLYWSLVFLRVQVCLRVDDAGIEAFFLRGCSR